MMEHTTDRLFWTLTSVIVGALLLTIGIKAFPQMAQNVLQPVSGIMKQADTANGHVSDAASQVLNDSAGSSTQASPANNQNMSGTTSQNDPDAQAKANAVEASTLGFVVVDNGDGTGTITGYNNNVKDVTIPKYIKLNGNILTVTSIGRNAFSQDNLTSVNIPNSVKIINSGAFAINNLTSLDLPDSITTIDNDAFCRNQLTYVHLPNSITKISSESFAGNNLTNITIPSSVTMIGTSAFVGNKLTSVNIPNINAYQEVTNPRWKGVFFDSNVTITNNPNNQ